MFRSSLAGRTFLFASFPSPAAAGYWATFTKSLRDESSAHTPKLYIDADRRLPDEVGSAFLPTSVNNLSTAQFYGGDAIILTASGNEPRFRYWQIQGCQRSTRTLNSYASC
jgi:hypothetical protein